MTTTKKILCSLLVLGVVGVASGIGAWSAFSQTTSNPSNSFAAGSVTISDNDANVPIYSLTNRKPGDFAEHCVRVTYTGSLAANVRFYRSAFSGGTGLDAYLDVTVTKGTGSQFDCSDFAQGANPTGGIYSGTLAALGTAFGSGQALTNAGGSAAWAQNDAVTYRIKVALQDTNAAQSLTTGTHSLVWEAQNT